jgi:hypothetical protein
VSYPIAIVGKDGEPLASTTTVDLSRGGAFFRLPQKDAPAANSVVEVSLSAPGADRRVTDFCCRARVVRRQPAGEAGDVGVALEFACPLPLALGE